jgi:hypothetical protein
MIGFAKLPLWHYETSEHNTIGRKIRNHFFTISYPDKIERRMIINGRIEARF